MSNQLANKMQTYTEVPPPMVWNAIAKRLDEQKIQEENFGKKMQETSIEPPAGIWNEIAEKLDAQETKVVPFGKNTKVIGTWKYAAAAVVIGLVATTIWFTTNKSETTTPVAVNNPIPSNNDMNGVVKQPTTGDTTNKQIVSNNTTANNDVVASNPTTNTNKKNQKVNSKKIGLTSEPTILSTQDEDIDIASVNPLDNGLQPIVSENGQVVEDINSINASNRYITIVGPNGESVRISSKFSKQLGLFGGQSEEAIDVIIKESAKWRTTITKWRKLMNNAKVSPSFENFMDINAMSKLLEQ